MYKDRYHAYYIHLDDLTVLKITDRTRYLYFSEVSKFLDHGGRGYFYKRVLG